MPLLGAIAYDPTTAVSKATTAALAMTALDTTNLRLTFTAPSSGRVVVRVRGVVHGATTSPQLVLGVLDGTTVRLRMGSSVAVSTGVATSFFVHEVWGPVTGLTAGTSYTWDAAYGVETLVSSTGLKYGGPNNTTANDAYGALVYEIYAG